MMDRPVPKRSAYLRPRTVQQWPPDACRSWAERVRDTGIDAVVTKISALTDLQAAAFQAAGVTLIGSFTCYSPVGAATTEAGRSPVGADGEVPGPVEWYSGLVPGDPELEDARAAEFSRLLDRGLVPLMVLDFLRWPGHWETESRHGAVPPASSFDPATLTRFVGWARERGIDPRGVHPADPVASAAVLLSCLKQPWLEFRAGLVTSFARRLGALAHQQSVAVGAFLVPLPDAQRREFYGQDVHGLAQELDLLVPMTYHAIAGRPARWTREHSLEVSRSTARATVAMVQLTSSRECSGGWDWGVPIQAAEVRATIEELESDMTRGALAGYCLFPGETLPMVPDIRSTLTSTIQKRIAR